jgi:hypothetical protein
VKFKHRVGEAVGQSPDALIGLLLSLVSLVIVCFLGGACLAAACALRVAFFGFFSLSS